MKFDFFKGCKILAIFFLLGPCISGANHLSGDEPDITRLFAYPHLWGMEPTDLKWSPQDEILAFRWNDRGQNTLDIWIHRKAVGRLVNLTNLIKIKTEACSGRNFPRRGVTQFDWSPNGKLIAFVADGDIFLVDLDGNTTSVVKSENRENEVMFSPDGRHLAFLMDGDLFLMQINSLEKKRITNHKNRHSSIISYSWSPNGKNIAFLLKDSSELTPVAIPDYTGRFIEMRKVLWPLPEYGQEKYRVGIVRISEHRTIWTELETDRIFAPYSSIKSIKWASDSSAFSFRASGANCKDWYLWLINPEGKAVLLVKDHDSCWIIPSNNLKRRVEWSSDCRRIYFTSNKNGYMHIYGISLSDRKITQLTHGNWDVFAFVPCPIRKGMLYVSSGIEPYFRTLFYQNLEDSSIKQLCHRQGTVSDLVISPGGKQFAYTYQDSLHPPEIFTASLCQKKPEPVKITESPLPKFTEYRWIRSKYIQIRNEPDDKRLHMKILTPEIRLGEKYPAIISGIYADSARDIWFWQWNVFDHWLVNELGCVVVKINLRSSTGQGKDFYTGLYQKLGSADVEEIISTVKFLKTLDYVDTDKLGIWGASYGGTLVLMSLFKNPGLFKAGVSVKPAIDWRNSATRYARSRLGVYEGNEHIYMACSPLSFFQGLSDPLLIIHGMQDKVAVFQDTLKLAQKLIENGKNFELFTYPKENHSMSGDNVRGDMFRRIGAFLKRELGLN